MKNIKKTIFIFFLFISANLIAYANSNFSFNLTANAGLMNGTIKEFVFAKNSTNTDNVLSLLDWDIKNIPVINFNGKLTLFKYSFIQSNGFFGISKSSGNMQDYDWLKLTPELTNYSLHNNNLCSYYGFNISAGINFLIPVINFRLSPIISYQYEYIAFDGTNGYRTYESENWNKMPFDGKVISYFQQINAFLFGIDFELPFFTFFNFYGNFCISPNATSIQALDFHYLNRQQKGGTAYLDILNSTFQMQATAQLDFFLNKHNKFFFSAFFQYIPMQKGLDYTRDITSTGKYKSNSWKLSSKEDIAGTSRFLYKLSLGYTFTL